MRQLTEFERGQIVGARMAGASVTRTAEILNVSRGTVSKVLTAYSRYGQTASAKRNCGRKSKLSETDRQALLRIVIEKRQNKGNIKATTLEITTELNQNRCDPVSARTVRRELRKVLGRLKQDMGINNIPIHTIDSLDKALKKPFEEEDDEEMDEDWKTQNMYEDNESSLEENGLQDTEEETKPIVTKDAIFQ